jgi:hypothetical protein
VNVASSMAHLRSSNEEGTEYFITGNNEEQEKIIVKYFSW